MVEADFDRFTALLDGTCRMLSREQYEPSAQATAVFFNAMRDFTLEQVERAFELHVRDPKRGRFAPTPSDLIEQIQQISRADGRLGPEEAWSVALRARDESETVVWHAETEASFAIAKPLLDARDQVGARMAFREAYERLVGEARSAGKPAEVRVSLGHDPEKRAKALREAHATGLLAAPTEQMQLLEGPGAKAAGFEPLMRNPHMPKHTFDALMRFKERVKAKVEKPEVTLDPGIARTKELREVHDEKLRVYLRDNPQAAADYEASVRCAEELLAGEFRAPARETLPPKMRGAR